MPEVDTERLDYNVCVMRYLAQLIRECPDILSADQWDFVLLTLDGWIGDDESCVSCVNIYLCIHTCILLSTVLHMFQKCNSAQH